MSLGGENTLLKTIMNSTALPKHCQTEFAFYWSQKPQGIWKQQQKTRYEFSLQMLHTCGGHLTSMHPGFLLPESDSWFCSSACPSPSPEGLLISLSQSKHVFHWLTLLFHSGLTTHLGPVRPKGKVYPPCSEKRFLHSLSHSEYEWGNLSLLATIL